MGKQFSRLTADLFGKGNVSFAVVEDLCRQFVSPAEDCF
jgi:hypothetical protein